jgi:hypothetical protein
MKKLLSIMGGVSLAFTMGISAPASANDAAPNSAEKKSAAIVQKAYGKLVVRQIGQQTNLVAGEFSAVKSVIKSTADLKKYQTSYSKEHKSLSAQKTQYSKDAKIKQKDVAKKALRPQRYTQRSGNEKTCAKNIKAVETQYSKHLNALYNDATKLITAERTAARKAGKSPLALKLATEKVRDSYVKSTEKVLDDAMSELAASCGFVKK